MNPIIVVALVFNVVVLVNSDETTDPQKQNGETANCDAAFQEWEKKMNEYVEIVSKSFSDYVNKLEDEMSRISQETDGGKDPNGVKDDAKDQKSGTKDQAEKENKPASVDDDKTVMQDEGRQQDNPTPP